MSQLYPVPFHGDTVYCAEFNGEPFAPMRPIIDNLGVDWGSQFRKLNTNKDRWGVVILTTPSSGGEQQTLCIPVRKLPAFLASINARKVRPELHDKLIRYQNECDDALWNYWTGRQAQAKAPVLEPSTKEDRLPLRNLVSEWAHKTGQEFRSCWTQLSAAFSLASIKDMPAEWLPDAIKWVQAKIDAAQPALPAPDPDPAKKELVPAADLPETKRLAEKNDVLRSLRGALAKLDFAYQVQGLKVNLTRCTGREEQRKYLYIASMSNINAAAATVRALICDEESRKK